MKPSLQLQLSQQLKMTPQLQQAIRLLQLPLLELNSQLEQALAENVMLECEEPEDTVENPDDLAPEPDEPAIIAETGEETGLWSDIPDSGGRGDTWADDTQRPEIADRSEESLRDHLLWQLEMEHFTPREIVMGQSIVDYINDDGYLIESLENIQGSLASEANFSLDEIEGMLLKVQTLDPIGIGARDLSECIRIQIRQLDESEPGRLLALEIAKSGLELVAEKQYAMLRRRLGVSEEDLDIALALVKACHPRPGSAVQPSSPEYIIPDVYVRKQDGQWVIEINHSMAPKLRVNQTYAKLLRGNGHHANLRNQLQEARWLVRSLDIRHETMQKVAMCIVSRQIEFLEKGEEAMKPMILRDVAEAVNMHESTISRVTSNKYMHTPRGIFELRYFFSSQLAATDGSEQSSTAIRAKIRRFIGHENPTRPLSDSKLVALLTEEGIKIARRTVAKYRESMKIAPSSERRQRPP